MNNPQEGRHGDTRPIPDPTVLTTEASNRLEKILRELILSEITHLNDLFLERAAKADLRFDMLEQRIAEQKSDTEARTAEQKSDTKAALDAALAAQKEAVASQTANSEKSITKSETATIERIKTVETLLSASTRATDDKIDDIKSRVVAIEAVKLGGIEQTATIRATGNDLRGNMAAIIGVISVVITVGSVLVAVFIATKH